MGTHDRPSASAGLFILRTIVGLVFVIHGGQKLFQFGLPGVAQSMGHLGIPLPAVAAVVVTLVEFVGGILMFLGLFVRPAAALIAIDMLVAVLAVHLRRGFFNPGGFEYPLTLLCINVALVFLGAGAWSIDGWVAGGQSDAGESARVR